MTTRVTRLPDVGEGVAEAELVAWHVAVGDAVTPDSVVAEVLTDKATVEIYAPVAGTVSAIHGEVGDVLAVGSELIAIETDDDDEPAVDGAAPQHDGSDASTPDATTAGASTPDASDLPAVPRPDVPSDSAGAEASEDGTTERVAPSAGRATAAPAVRARARALGIDLRAVAGTGVDGRVTHGDLDRHLRRDDARTGGGGGAGSLGTSRTPVIGLRRRIAERLADSASRIPHITYVDEVDVTALEDLRSSLATRHPDQLRVTLLPFLIRAIVVAVAEQPHLNATFDDEAFELTTHGAVHVGIATQTPNGLVVPVVRDAQRLDLWAAAAEVARVAGAARDGTARREELSGSTITITSLGALGGLVTTPILNPPEVAIVGVNKMQVRPVWDGTTFSPRTMMNLSSSFDHRIVDGWDAATFVQRIKGLLEQPALLFVPPPPA